MEYTSVADLVSQAKNPIRVIIMEYYAQKIYTKNGLAKDDPFPGKKVLHFGAGAKKLPGSTSIDILNLPEVDIVHDLDKYPWPFEDNSFDVVFGHNALEHLTDIVVAMDEIHRLLKPGGRLIVTVPYFRSTDAYTDPTHKHFFTSKSLDYFIQADSTLSAYRYSDKLYKKIRFWYGWPQPSSSLLNRFFKNLILNYPKFYDSYLSLLLPVKIVIWELEVTK